MNIDRKFGFICAETALVFLIAVLENSTTEEDVKSCFYTFTKISLFCTMIIPFAVRFNAKIFDEPIPEVIDAVFIILGLIFYLSGTILSLFFSGSSADFSDMTLKHTQEGLSAVVTVILLCDAVWTIITIVKSD